MDLNDEQIWITIQQQDVEREMRRLEGLVSLHLYFSELQEVDSVLHSLPVRSIPPSLFRRPFRSPPPRWKRTGGRAKARKNAHKKYQRYLDQPDDGWISHNFTESPTEEEKYFLVPSTLHCVLSRALPASREWEAGNVTVHGFFSDRDEEELPEVFRLSAEEKRRVAKVIVQLQERPEAVPWPRHTLRREWWEFMVKQDLPALAYPWQGRVIHFYGSENKRYYDEEMLLFWFRRFFAERGMVDDVLPWDALPTLEERCGFPTWKGVRGVASLVEVTRLDEEKDLSQRKEEGFLLRRKEISLPPLLDILSEGTVCTASDEEQGEWQKGLPLRVWISLLCGEYHLLCWKEERELEAVAEYQRKYVEYRQQIRMALYRLKPSLASLP